VDPQENLESDKCALSFKVLARCGQARLGSIQTRHGQLDTPLFMPVGTQATVKALTPQEVADTGARMIIMNTYHLWLRPGPEVVSEQGGLHGFSRWPHAIATDSGGFQAYSLASLGKISEEGIAFQSHLDGSRRMLTPEESLRIQGLLGSDIAMQLDVCADASSSRDVFLEAMERTTRWAKRCIVARNPGQALFGIIQGGTHLDLRRRHAYELAELPLDGLALGGFSVGEPTQVMDELLDQVVPHVDEQRPRYLMGVGTPSNLVRAIARGIDFFDCVLPTRNARNGQAFTNSGRLVIKQACYKDDPRPLEENCQCPTCESKYSRAYLRHLFMSREILSHRLLTLHNLHFYGRLMIDAREAISHGSFAAWATSTLARWQNPNM
jgi:queuine tRNA-ribosyltransferase